MKRAYSLLTIKSIDEDLRIITGIATTPTTDRMDDIVEPEGAEFELPLPFLWQHDTGQPVGHVTAAKPGPAGIPVTIQMVKSDEPGTLKDRLDEAWQSVKLKLVRGLSIGFRAIESIRIEGTWGYRYTKWEWLELSAVTIAANMEATITTVKSLDTAQRAASGRERRDVVRLIPPASGTVKLNPPEEGKGNMKISEKIAAFEAKRAANLGRITAIHEATDSSLDDAQLEEIKGLEAEVATIDRDLASLKPLEAALAKGAKPAVPAARTVKAADGSEIVLATPGVSVKQQEKLAPGIAFTRIAKIKLAARLVGCTPLMAAKGMYGEDSETYATIRKANEVASGSNTSGNWAADLTGAETSTFADFVEYLRPQTILGKFGKDGIPGLRQVPFREPLISQTGGGAAYWVGEGKGKPLTSFDFDRTTLVPLKIANIAVLTEENIKSSAPRSDTIVRDGLVAALVEGQDVAFIDPANSGSSNVKPASITNGATAIASTGTDADHIRLEVRALMKKFTDANNPPSMGVWIMSSTTALALALMVNALGQPEFPGITMKGGTFIGMPVIVSDHVGTSVALVNASDIYEADDGEVAVDMSREASLEMKSVTTEDAVAGTGAAMVSMFQTNSVAIRAERTINWKRRRTMSVAYLTSVNWGGDVPAS